MSTTTGATAQAKSKLLNTEVPTQLGAKTPIEHKSAWGSKFGRPTQEQMDALKAEEAETDTASGNDLIAKATHMKFDALVSALKHAQQRLVTIPIATKDFDRLAEWDRTAKTFTPGKPKKAKQPIGSWAPDKAKGVEPLSSDLEATFKRFGWALKRVKASGGTVADIGVGVRTAESGVTSVDVDAHKIIDQDSSDDTRDVKLDKACRSLLDKMFKQAGVKAAKDRKAAVDKLMVSPHTRSAKGGYHFDFKTPPGAKPGSRDGYIENVDIKAGHFDDEGRRHGGALIYVPGTVTAHGAYVAYDADGNQVDTIQLCELPDVLLNAFENAKAGAAKKSATGLPKQRMAPTNTLGGSHDNGLKDPIGLLSCKLVEAYKAAPGEVEYAGWRDIVQLAAYTEGGEQLAHELSSLSPDYNVDCDTQQKFDDANVNRLKGQGPITCATLRADTNQKLKACDGCPLAKRNGASPVNLQPLARPVPAEPIAPDAAQPEPIEADLNDGLPEGYFNRGGRLWLQSGKDKGDGADLAIELCGSFRVMSRGRDENDEGWGWNLEVRLPTGTWHKTFIPRKTVANKRDLMATLSDKGFEPKFGSVYEGIITTLFNGLNPKTNSRRVRRAGWHGSQFLRTDGTVLTNAPVSDSLVYAGDRSEEQNTKGTHDQWVEHVAKKIVGQTLATSGATIPLARCMNTPATAPCDRGRSHADRNQPLTPALTH